MITIIKELVNSYREYYNPVVELCGGTSPIYIPRKHSTQSYASQRRISKRGRR
jgi:hypothetical protein